ncbi:MAG: hypothetical protein U0P30_01115 [Vicinamibacterales bacterium]
MRVTLACTLKRSSAGTTHDRDHLAGVVTAYEPRGDLQAVAVLLHTAFHEVRHAQRRANASQVLRGVAEHERRRPRRHPQPGHAREAIGDLVGEAIDERVPGRVAGEVRQRQHGQVAAGVRSASREADVGRAVVTMANPARPESATPKRTA